MARPSELRPCADGPIRARRRTASALVCSSAAVCPSLGACNRGAQSALDPAGPHADAVASVFWVLVVGAALIFLVVLSLTALAVWAAPERRRWLADRRVVTMGGIAFPVATLTALVIYDFAMSRDLVGDAGREALTVEVTGEQFWWRVHYLNEAGDLHFATANEIRMPIERPVRFVLKSQDVIHSFWVPSLAGKLDMIPGQANSYRFSATRPGVYRGQCAEFCGIQHALMAFLVEAMPPDRFAAWSSEQTRPAQEPTTPLAERGKAQFLELGCGACHAVRGTEAEGILGPDLTHVGSRLSIAAGTLPNNADMLAAWTASSQHIKPGNRMPPFEDLQGEDLRAIAAYLESLK